MHFRQALLSRACRGLWIGLFGILLAIGSQRADSRPLQLSESWPADCRVDADCCGPLSTSRQGFEHIFLKLYSL
jgi:hypothetical protein